MQNNGQEGYIPSLDALRGIAVIVVMLSHFLGKIWYFSLLGSFGVTLFFVLSGFLITRILLKIREKYSKSGRIIHGMAAAIKSFYIRRTLRIFPLYYLVLFLAFFFNVDSARAYSPYYLFYASNFLYPTITGYDSLSHFWTLAVEEQFYLFWPLVIFLLMPEYKRISFFLGLSFLSLIFRFLMLFLYGGWGWFYLMPSSISLFAFGAVVLLLKERTIPATRLKSWLFLTFILTSILTLLPYKISNVTLIYFCLGMNQWMAGITLSLLILMILKGYFTGWVKCIIQNRFLVLTGKISYGIYIFHMFIPDFVALGVDPVVDISITYFLQAFFYMIVSIVVAYLSYFFYETPLNRYKSRFLY